MKKIDKQLDVLVLAPHPFFINRGTPIDVFLLVRALSEKGYFVDMVVYPEGEDIALPRVSVHRVPFSNWIKNVRPGFSLKKLFLDFIMLFTVWKKVHQKRYAVIHAGEEAVFMAMLMKLFYKIPYIYDLDSSIAQQLVEKNSKLKPFAKIFNWLEARAIQGAIANAPVCNALGELCEKNGSAKTIILHDISQLNKVEGKATVSIRQELGLDGIIVLYCGNLEEYQGVDLLIESFPYALEQEENINLVIIGGAPEDIEYYKKKAADLGLKESVHFLGPRPFEQLGEYLADADILVAPRIKGVNTPMKIFPYMHSGKPVLLTKLYTHTQIVSSKEAYLAEPVPQEFGKAIAVLAADEELRNRLGFNGQSFVEKNHVYSAHKKRVETLYDWVEKTLSERC
jgi:glycosyltransferase involved in cell wall biosynthesis